MIASPTAESRVTDPVLGDLLVIGYGNTLRQDDGVGPRVAEQVEELGLPGVRTLVAAQLSPEHAEPVSLARGVVFVDAASNASSGMEMRPLAPAGSSQVTTHAAEPATLLALARDLFGRATVDGWGFDLEVLAMAHRLGHRVVEVPVTWHDDRRSRVRPLHDLARVWVEVRAIRRSLAVVERDVEASTELSRARSYY